MNRLTCCQANGVRTADYRREEPVPGRAKLTVRKRIAFPVVLAFGVIILAEVLLHLLASSSRSIDALLSVEPVRSAVRDRELVWRGNPEHPEHDRLGFRNRDVPPTASVVALGDSQTYGSRVDREDAWPQQLERLGGGRTYNQAFPGWGPPQFLLTLDEALALKPGVVVTALYTGNDLVDSYTFVYHRKRLTTLRTSDERARKAIETAEDADPWDNDPIADQMPTKLADPDDDDDPPMSLEDLLAANSKLYGLAIAIDRAYDYYRRHPDRPEADDETDPLKDDDYLILKTGQFKTVLTPSYRQQAVDLGDPRVVEGLQITTNVLAKMREQCAAQGARFAVVLIPTKELALREVAAENLAQMPPVYHRLVEQESAARRRIAEQLAAREIELIDTLPALVSLANNGRLPYSDTKDGHLSPLGQRAVAEVVRGAIPRDPLESRPLGVFGPLNVKR